MIISKRFEFSAAHLVPNAHRPRETRLHGHNYVLWAGVSGEPDSKTGIIVNLAALKTDVLRVLDRNDHHYLNEVVGSPTVEAAAASLWNVLAAAYDAAPLARLELSEDDGDAASVTPAATYALARGLFSAAHRTHIPTFSAEANLALFGICNNEAGHGHNYRVVVESEGDSETAGEALQSALREFDHRNLSVDIPDLAGRNVTTEVIARLLWRRLEGLPLHRIRLYELPDFFAEYAGAGNAACLGRRYTFSAAHRLASPHLSPAENEALYGKCNRPEPHGHSYRVEVTVAGEINAETSLAMDLADLDGPAGEVIAALDGRHLDKEIAAFCDLPSTGENILAYLWRELENRFGAALARVRLWETRNNRFEIDRRGEEK